MEQKFAEGMRGGVPPWKEGETIDLRIAHWCLFAPHASGMYETVRELVTAENQIEGVLAGMCETPGPGTGKSAMERAAEGGRVDPMHPEFRTQDWGWGLKYPDIHVVHTTLFDRIGELEPKVFFAHGCFHRNQLIRLADGSMRKLMELKVGDLVPSKNRETGYIETDVITDIGSNGMYEKWMKITPEDGPRLICTDDHPFETIDGTMEAKNLKPGMFIESGELEFSDIQRSIILGANMGDAYPDPNSLAFSHRNKDYNDVILNFFQGYNIWRKDYPTGYGSRVERVKISLKRNQVPRSNKGPSYDRSPFRKLYDFFVIDGEKRLTEKWLDGLSWISLAVLYLDDGSLAFPKYEKVDGHVSIYYPVAILHTCGLTEEDARKLSDTLRSRFGIENSLTTYDYPRIHINKQTAVKRFFDNITRVFPVPPSMEYKIPPEFLGRSPCAEDGLHWSPTMVKIDDISSLKMKAERWAITVKNNHNYLAGLCLVKNTPEACLENDLMPNLKSDSYGPGIRYIERCDATIVTSKRQELLWGPYDHSGDKIHRVDKGIDLEWWRKTFVKQELPGEPSVLYGEIWRGIKHPFHVLFAVNEIYKRNPKVKLNAWGCNIKKPFWQRLFEESNFDNFLGPRGIKDIVDYPEHYYSRGDVLANPVIYGDVTRVGQEALACGCPTVAWDTDPFGDTHAYAMAKAFDISAFAAEIEEIYEDLLDDEEAVHKKAREIAETHFDINVEAKQVVEILRKTVGEN